MLSKKTPQNRLKKYYTLLLEVGTIISLLIFIIAFKVDIPTKQKKIKMVEKQEVVKTKDIVQTKQQETPPAPPKPQVPVEVPNDEVVQEQNLDLNAELDLNKSLDVPKEPPENAGKSDQKKKEEEDEVFVVVEQQPELMGGIQSLQSKIQYPEMARKAGIEGRVYVRFIVNKNGRVEDPEVVRGIGGGCDKEALRVIKTAKFKPGLQRGRPVKVKMTMPIVFRLKNAE